jgi:hypothetical protein
LIDRLVERVAHGDNASQLVTPHAIGRLRTLLGSGEPMDSSWDSRWLGEPTAVRLDLVADWLPLRVAIDTSAGAPPLVTDVDLINGKDLRAVAPQPRQ